MGLWDDRGQKARLFLMREGGIPVTPPRSSTEKAL